MCFSRQKSTSCVPALVRSRFLHLDPALLLARAGKVWSASKLQTRPRDDNLRTCVPQGHHRSSRSLERHVKIVRRYQAHQRLTLAPVSERDERDACPWAGTTLNVLYM